MYNIKNFSDFFLLESAQNDSLRKKYGITDEEWEACRLNPEGKIPENMKQYFSGEKAKSLVSKLCRYVSTGIFGDPAHIASFMERVSKVESCYGTNPSTYTRSSFTKGIFQLDKASSLATIGYQGKSPDGNELLKKYINECRSIVKSKVGLSWDMVPYSNIAKPLYNVIAARIFIGVKIRSYNYDKKTGKLTEIKHPIPTDLNGQAKWWKSRYNTKAGGGSEANFKNPPGCSI